QARQWCDSGRGQRRPGTAVEEIKELVVERTVAVVNSGEDERRRRFGVPGGRPRDADGGEARARGCGAQEQHVIGVDHRRVRGGAVGLPDWSTVEAGQSLSRLGIVSKPRSHTNRSGLSRSRNWPKIAIPSSSWLSTNSRSNSAISASR